MDIECLILGLRANIWGNRHEQRPQMFLIYTVYIKQLSEPRLQETLRHKGKLLSGEESAFLTSSVLSKSVVNIHLTRP